ncbi:FHA domain-containing protein [Luteococcus sp. OSA5]|uniref:FHA domain-containing protein n=1 Tax=Luteococcus sp. OSA5 TaxID=3401630 RepID=UPI003B42A941
MVECPQCGTELAADANFCSNCGGRIAPQGTPAGDSTRMIPVVTESTGTLELGADDMAAVNALPQEHALLIVERGPGAGARYLLDNDEVTVGRHPDSDIFLDDITVSRHHVKFTLVDGNWHVADQNSLNGTYVNRTLVDGQAMLRQGDEVQIGKFRMIFFVSEPGLR